MTHVADKARWSDMRVKLPFAYAGSAFTYTGFAYEPGCVSTTLISEAPD